MIKLGDEYRLKDGNIVEVLNDNKDGTFDCRHPKEWPYVTYHSIDLWDKVEPRGTYTLPEGNAAFWDSLTKSCPHAWVDVGFHFSKWVCKHCDVAKP